MLFHHRPGKHVTSFPHRSGKDAAFFLARLRKDVAFLHERLWKAIAPFQGQFGMGSEGQPAWPGAGGTARSLANRRPPRSVPSKPHPVDATCTVTRADALASRSASQWPNVRWPRQPQRLIRKARSWKDAERAHACPPGLMEGPVRKDPDRPGRTMEERPD